MTGFEFAETMAGSFRLLEGAPEERAISFTVRARSRSWLDFARRREVDIEGEIDADGFADHEHLRGTLEMDMLFKRRLSYAFTFRGNDGARYAFAGEKILRPPLAEAMTVLPGAIRDAAGRVVAEALLRFDLRSDLGRFLRSFRRAI
ncbi:MAG TPA: hypothetical protein VHB21_16010 [Minicystis sp.]|nr:hypothetical protein [Minicystis sp.]